MFTRFAVKHTVKPHLVKQWSVLSTIKRCLWRRLGLSQSINRVARPVMYCDHWSEIWLDNASIVSKSEAGTGSHRSPPNFRAPFCTTSYPGPLCSSEALVREATILFPKPAILGKERLADAFVSPDGNSRAELVSDGRYQLFWFRYDTSPIPWILVDTDTKIDTDTQFFPFIKITFKTRYII
jgi:hypothetical protein